MQLFTDCVAGLSKISFFNLEKNLSQLSEVLGQVAIRLSYITTDSKFK